MLKVQCPRCKLEFNVPITLEQKIKDEIGIYQQSHNFALAVKHLRTHTDFDIRLSKALLSHIPMTAGQCRRCASALPDEEIVDCQKCRSLNVNW